MLRFAKTRLWVASAYYIIAFNLTYVNPKYFPFQKVICKKKNPKKQKKTISFHQNTLSLPQGGQVLYENRGHGMAVFINYLLVTFYNLV